MKGLVESVEEAHEVQARIVKMLDPMLVRDLKQIEDYIRVLFVENEK